MDPLMALRSGARFPYDAGKAWWSGRAGETPPPAADWAHTAARGVLADLSDRSGLKHDLHEVSHEVRAEIIASLAAIIRKAATTS